MANVLVYHSNTKDYREYEQLHSNKLYNLEEMDKFRETQNLPRVNHKEIENLNKPITNKDIESVIKNLTRKKSPEPNRESYQTFSYLIAVVLKIFQKIEEEG